MFALLLAACAQPLDDIASWHAAASAPARERCEAIADRELRDDCLYWLAWETLPDLSVCEGIGDAGRRADCAFAVVDRQGVVGPRAVELCAATGDLALRCLTHALERDVGREAGRFPPGTEQAFLAYVTRQVSAYGLAGSREPIPGNLLRNHLAHRLCPEGERGACGAFGPAVCGAADEATCLEALDAVLASPHRSSALRATCRAGPTPESAAAAGLPTWEPAQAAAVLPVWRAHCGD